MQGLNDLLIIHTPAAPPVIDDNGRIVSTWHASPVLPGRIGVPQPTDLLSANQRQQVVTAMAVIERPPNESDLWDYLQPGSKVISTVLDETYTVVSVQDTGYNVRLSCRVADGL